MRPRTPSPLPLLHDDLGEVVVVTLRDVGRAVGSDACQIQNGAEPFPFSFHEISGGRADEVGTRRSTLFRQPIQGLGQLRLKVDLRALHPHRAPPGAYTSGKGQYTSLG